MSYQIAIGLIASTLPSTVAHGWVSAVTIAAKTYTGNAPLETQPNTGPSIIRQVADNMPVSNPALDELICGRGATPAALVAHASPGDLISISWGGYAEDRGSLWIHNVGPLLTYLAACETSCAMFNPTEATEWFKISEQGTMTDGHWYQDMLCVNLGDDGLPANVTLPANLKAGHYLLRHEVIALHMAEALGGAEFFPSCIQLNVTGSGTGEPITTHFPGAYKSTDPGIHLDPHTNFDVRNYRFPGPPVAAFVDPQDS
ncbi:glycoside hydrolase [Mycena leptocephala]|nr:glycoside hydrolase [Mycena leptocephala]